MACCVCVDPSRMRPVRLLHVGCMCIVCSILLMSCAFTAAYMLCVQCCMRASVVWSRLLRSTCSEGGRYFERSTLPDTWWAKTATAPCLWSSFPSTPGVPLSTVRAICNCPFVLMSFALAASCCTRRCTIKHCFLPTQRSLMQLRVHDIYRVCRRAARAPGGCCLRNSLPHAASGRRLE